LEDLSSELVLITPEMAEEMLETRLPNQRNVRWAKVKLMAKLMKEGQNSWMVNGDSIKFDSGGHLMDGQHRLEGVVLSGVAVWVYVIRGLRPQAFATLDIGTPRNLGDIVRAAGYGRATERGALLTWLWRFSQGPSGVTRREGAPSVTALDLHEEWLPLIEESLVAIAHVRGVQNRWMAFLRMLYVVTKGQLPEEQVLLLTKKLSKGFPMVDDDPVAALRTYLVDWSDNARGSGTSMGRKTGMYGPSRPPVYMIKVWNAFFLSKNYKVLRLGKNERWQVPLGLHPNFRAAWVNPGLAPRGKG